MPTCSSAASRAMVSMKSKEPRWAMRKNLALHFALAIAVDDGSEAFFERFDDDAGADAFRCVGCWTRRKQTCLADTASSLGTSYRSRRLRRVEFAISEHWQS